MIELFFFFHDLLKLWLERLIRIEFIFTRIDSCDEEPISIVLNILYVMLFASVGLLLLLW